MIALSNLYVAMLDTCALAPTPLCDTLLRLAENPPSYIPKWSPDILRELRYADGVAIKLGLHSAERW